MTDVILLLVLCYFNMLCCSVPDQPVSLIPPLASCSCSHQIKNTDTCPQSQKQNSLLLPQGASQTPLHTTSMFPLNSTPLFLKIQGRHVSRLLSVLVSAFNPNSLNSLSIFKQRPIFSPNMNKNKN